jgi:Protein of unknown function (DUF3276)
MQLTVGNNTQSSNFQDGDQDHSNYSGGGNYQNELFTWKIKAGTNRIYYLNVKKDKNDELYIVIKESKNLMDGGRDVHRIMVFQKDFEKFVFGMKKTLEFINSQNSTPQDNSSDLDLSKQQEPEDQYSESPENLSRNTEMDIEDAIELN